MTELNLLPCPFCGGQATPEFSDYSSYVSCEECDISTRACTHPDEAAFFWNRRADGWIAVGDALPEVGHD